MSLYLAQSKTIGRRKWQSHGKPRKTLASAHHALRPWTPKAGTRVRILSVPDHPYYEPHVVFEGKYTP